MAITPDKLTPGQLKILQAVAVLLENPANKITIQRIAAEIHVTEGAIYRHFRGKDVIFESIMSYLEANLVKPLNAVQQHSPDAHQRLATVFQSYMSFLEGHPGFCRLLLGHGANEAPDVADRLKLLHAKLRAQLAQIVKFGQAQGDVPRLYTPEQLTELMYGQIVAAAATLAYNLPHLSGHARWDVLKKVIFG